MATVRKRIGGGWKNVKVTKTDECESGMWNTQPEREEKQKHVSGNSTSKQNLQRQANLSVEVEKKADVFVNSCDNNDESEYKLRLDAMVNEKISEPSERTSGTNAKSETKKSNFTNEDESLEDDVELDDTLHLREIRSSLSTSTPVKAKSSEMDSKLGASFSNYADHPVLKRVQDSVIGYNLVIKTPYGQRKVTYCDYTASGRCLSFIEDFMRKNVIPTYANTHSSTGHNARQTGKYREEARSIIKRCVNGNKDDMAIFTGSGATAGMHKLAWALKLNSPRIAAETAVFVGPYEHHSNILLWRELSTKVVRIRHDSESGMVDLDQLGKELKFWKEKKRHLLVCMSAASNVTGIITDVDAVSKLAHQNGALAIFDYAGGGPYLKIDMNTSKLEYKDAVVISPHKFVGGPGTPGVIIAKKWVFRNTVPDKVGGGTVRFVTREQHAYVGNIEEREEGGTPAIIESIRAGIVFQLKQEIGTDLIHAREKILTRRAFSVWEKNPSILVLGSHTADRVSIFSFLTIHQQTGRLIHHNFISTLLSDLYGIQARGGCACAGPYAQDLLGLSESTAKKYMFFLSEKTNWKEQSGIPHMEIMKPGFTRINLSYFMDDDTADFVIEAVDMVTRHGWKLMPKYSFDLESASWYHKSYANTPAAELMSLRHALADDGQPAEHAGKSPSYKEILETARELYEVDDKSYTRSRISSASLLLRENLPTDKRGLRWFLTPHEAMNIMADTDEKYLNRKLYRLPFNLQQPSFMSELKADDVYDKPVSLPRISHQRERMRDNRLGSNADRRYQRLSLKGKGEENFYLPSINTAGYRNNQRKHDKKSYEEKVIGIYATPRRQETVRDTDIHQSAAGKALDKYIDSGSF